VTSKGNTSSVSKRTPGLGVWKQWRKKILKRKKKRERKEEIEEEKR
jgi:hypothetical protein